MITDLVLNVLLGVPAFVLSLVPAMPLPDWLTGTGSGTIAGGIAGIISSVGAVDAWIPAGQAFAAIALVATVFAGLWVVRMVRIVASFFTGGGGSAA